MNFRPAPWLAWTLVGLWFTAINVASFLPGSEVEKTMLFPGFDKMLHFAVFFLGAILLHTALSVGRSTARWPRWRRTFFTLGLLALFGAIDEFRQIWTPGREGANLLDFTANLAGLTVGAFLGHSFHALPSSRPRR